MHYLTAHYILVIAAFIVALLAAFQWIAAPRVNLVAMALALFFLSLLVGCQQTDNAFRSRVESAEFTAAGTGDKAGNYGGTVGTKLTFRDPRTTRDNK